MNYFKIYYIKSEVKNLINYLWEKKINVAIFLLTGLISSFISMSLVVLTQITELSADDSESLWAILGNQASLIVSCSLLILILLVYNKIANAKKAQKDIFKNLLKEKWNSLEMLSA